MMKYISIYLLLRSPTASLMLYSRMLMCVDFGFWIGDASCDGGCICAERKAGIIPQTAIAVVFANAHDVR